MAIWKGGRPRMLASRTAVKSMRGMASPAAFSTVTPQAFMMRAAI